jgi:site-specific DNA recombinase
MKRYLALARVSSREQEREGFSLDVQEEGLTRYAERHGGQIDKLYRIAETASKQVERRIFKELLAYAREHATDLSGLLFYKVDRAARNLFDYVELERLEAEYGLEVVYVAQPTENSPSGRMQRRMLANMASFYTEQQSLDVKEGMARRVENGYFVSKAPYGYLNVRRDGRSVTEVDSRHGAKIGRIFHLFAYESRTLDSLQQRLSDEGLTYTETVARFPRSKLHDILRDRSYIGEVRYHGQWYPGVHQPLVDRRTFERVQALLGDKNYQAHELIYAGGLITCAVCDHPITGEQKLKQTKKGQKSYVYYRCARYNAAGHPRVRIGESDLELQVLELFDKIRIQDDKIRDWFGRVLRARAQDQQRDNQAQIAEINRQLTSLRQQQDRLLNLRLLEEIDQEGFAAKNTELRDRIARLSLDLEACGESKAVQNELAQKLFELSQSLKDKWFAADATAKRRLLETICLNFSLDGATLVPTIRKPFDILAEGLILKNSRRSRI